MKIISFYLPQYHPIPENDAWWGKGFTDWVNVAKARPRFKDHHQPQIPADLGFYDLRLEETRIAQAALAREHGISGFCYYHYWFKGKLLLERPFNEVLRSGKPDLPFCLCWANEDWTRAWDGMDREALIRQEYTSQDSIDHINWLCKAFRDPRYIRVNNKPLLLIYRTDNLPDVAERIGIWKKIAREHGFADLHLCSVRSNFNQMTEEEAIKTGFDAVVAFQPYYRDFPRMSMPVSLKLHLNRMYNELLRRLGATSLFSLRKVNHIYDYHKLVRAAMSRRHPEGYVKFPCVFPSWDSSARKKDASILQNNDPKLFQKWLLDAMQRVSRYSSDEQIVFINAWNEWGEGCHMEPDRRNGRIFLEAVREALTIRRAL